MLAFEIARACSIRYPHSPAADLAHSAPHIVA